MTQGSGGTRGCGRAGAAAGHTPVPCTGMHSYTDALYCTGMTLQGRRPSVSSKKPSHWPCPVMQALGGLIMYSILHIVYCFCNSRARFRERYHAFCYCLAGAAAAWSPSIRRVRTTHTPMDPRCVGRFVPLAAMLLSCSKPCDSATCSGVTVPGGAWPVSSSRGHDAGLRSGSHQTLPHQNTPARIVTAHF